MGRRKEITMIVQNKVPERIYTGMRNHYIGIIHYGELYPKTFRNPDKFPEDMKAAFEFAKELRKDANQYCSYPIIIKEILESDFTPKEETIHDLTFKDSQEAFKNAIHSKRL
jgi:hypothetical protein